jgi:hypothetical protein
LRRALQAAAAVAAAAACAGALLAHAKQLALDIGDIEAPAFSARSVKASLSGPGMRELALQIDRLSLGGRDWRKVGLTCADLNTAGGRIVCTRGVLHLDEQIPVSFSYATARGDLTIELKPAVDETWRISGRLSGPTTALELKIDRGRIQRLASWLPAAAPKLTAGRASGTIRLEGSAVSARLEIDGLAFADASGLHAGEKIAATLEADASPKGRDWQWNARLAWRAGEVFWQPFFVSATGQRLSVDGLSVAGNTEIRQGTLELPHVGSVAFKGRWDHAANMLASLEARASRLRVPTLYEQMLQPVLQQTALGDLRAEGEATVAVTAAKGALTSVDLELHDVSIEDRQQRRFALFGATGRVPWKRDEASTGELTFNGAEFLKVPVGAVRIPLRMRGGTAVSVSSVRVPILDGALQLRDFAAGTTEDGWRWRFSGQLEPISMVQLTQALGTPVMYGSLSGIIPDVRYRRGTLQMDGALSIGVFDGTVSASKVELIEPFGRAPRLHADIDMKNLDLELLTRTFDFGTMIGRIDASVRGLELVDWEPVRLDMRIESSAGSYPKRISQRAVQNISALGGAGAAAAIQRSFLRFFDQFSYQKIGLSCRLSNNVCEMEGVENAPQGYVIVKGGGIPSISVIGYNRHVNWSELVDRLKRITQENVKPIVK